MTPALSVLLPVYRPQQQYLTSAVQSILQQTFDDFELLIVEASSDTSAEPVIREFKDARIRYLPFTGPASIIDQLNFGLLQARGVLIARMDGDDWAYPERFERQLDYLKKHPDVVVVGTQISIMDVADRPLGYRRYPTEPALVANALRRYNPHAHPSVMFRKEHIMQVGGYSCQRYPANEDYELWCRLAQRGYLLANLDQTLLRYRIHPATEKSRKLKKMLHGTRMVKRHYYGDTMTAGDRARYCAEGLLLNMPVQLIMQLFRLLQYRQEP